MGSIRRPKHGPEWHIQKDVITYLRDEGWFVKRMIGNALQKGVPDLYCFHRKWGERWIDIKNPKSNRFTKDQKKDWPVWDAYGVGIWIIAAATPEEMDKLNGPPNWRDYWKDSWGDIPTPDDIDILLDELIAEELDEDDD